MSERLRSIKDLEVRSRWDGGAKFFTSECSECDWYEQLADGEVCLAGRAWKELTKERELKTCSTKKKVEKERQAAQAPRKPLIVYTPGLEDFYDGTLETLERLGFRQRLVPRDRVGRSGFTIEQG